MKNTEEQIKILSELDRSFPGRPLTCGEMADIANFINERKLNDASSSSSEDLMPLEPIVEEALERCLGFEPDPEVVTILSKALDGVSTTKGRVIAVRSQTESMLKRLPPKVTAGSLAAFRYFLADNSSRRALAKQHGVSESTLRKAEVEFLQFIGFELEK